MTFAVKVTGHVESVVHAELPALVDSLVASGITAGDSSLWGPAVEDEASRRLGWVQAVSVSRPLVPEITALRDDLLAEHLAMRPEEVAQAIAEHGSLIAMIEASRGPQGQGRTLIPYEIPELSDFEAWLADNEILDPEGPDKIFEPLGKRKGLIRRWRWPRRLSWRRRKAG